MAFVLLTGLWYTGIRALLFSPRLDVEVVMASEALGMAQLFADDGNGFREALSDRVTVAGEGFQVYRFDLEPDSTVRALRLDPLNVPGELRLRSIVVSYTGRRVRFTGPRLAEWTPTRGLKALPSQPGEAAFRAEDGDPWLVLEEDWPAVAPWRRLFLRPTFQEVALTLGILPFLALIFVPAARLGRGALLLTPVTPLVLFLSFNLKALDSWWIRDDPCLLASVHESGAAAHFFQPEVWRQLSGSVLMPWNLLSFELDLRLFGVEPSAFYAHQLVVFGLFFMVAAVFLRALPAPVDSTSAAAISLALALFAVSVPTHAVALQLMNRHYLEGLILMLGAFLLYLRAVRKKSLATAVGGAGLYLLAVTAKEVFVPLVVLLPLLPVGACPPGGERQWRDRLRYVLPFAAVTVAYLPWRLYMLGPQNVVSGYVAPSGEPVLGVLLSILGLDSPWRIVLLVLAVVASVVVVGRQSRAHLLLGGVAALLLAVPILPVLGKLAPRYFFLPAFLVAVLIAWGLEPWRGRRPALAAGIAVVLLLAVIRILLGPSFHRGYANLVEQFRVEGAYVLESPDDTILLTRLGDPQFLPCVAEVRQMAFERPGGPGYCGDVCWCSEAFAGAAFRSSTGGRILPVSSPEAAGCAVEEELAVEMSYDVAAGRLNWRFGPYEDGAYSILMVDNVSPPLQSPKGDNVSSPLESPQGDNVPPAVSVPALLPQSGEAPIALQEDFRLVVKYVSPAGWQTYSPMLALDPSVGELRWQR